MCPENKFNDVARKWEANAIIRHGDPDICCQGTILFAALLVRQL